MILSHLSEYEDNLVTVTSVFQHVKSECQLINTMMREKRFEFTLWLLPMAGISTILR